MGLYISSLPPRASTTTTTTTVDAANPSPTCPLLDETNVILNETMGASGSYYSSFVLRREREKPHPWNYCSREQTSSQDEGQELNELHLENAGTTAGAKANTSNNNSNASSSVATNTAYIPRAHSVHMGIDRMALHHFLTLSLSATSGPDATNAAPRSDFM